MLLAAVRYPPARYWRGWYLTQPNHTNFVWRLHASCCLCRNIRHDLSTYRHKGGYCRRLTFTPPSMQTMEVLLPASSAGDMKPVDLRTI